MGGPFASKLRVMTLRGWGSLVVVTGGAARVAGRPRASSNGERTSVDDDSCVCARREIEYITLCSNKAISVAHVSSAHVGMAHGSFILHTRVVRLYENRGPAACGDTSPDAAAQ